MSSWIEDTYKEPVSNSGTIQGGFIIACNHNSKTG